MMKISHLRKQQGNSMESDIIIYEQPLNETMRLALRLEYLLNELYTHRHISTPANHHLAMTALLKIVNVMDRPDLKAKLIQALTQQTLVLTQLEKSPQVDELKLQRLLSHVSQLIEQLHAVSGRMEGALREHAFLNQIRMHLSNPVGPCYFTTPAYAVWLKQTDQRKEADLDYWTKTLNLLNDVIQTFLTITREFEQTQSAVAQQGIYQQSFDPHTPYQLVRLGLSAEQQTYPEISISKHRMIIRFLLLPSADTQTTIDNTADIPFTVHYCRL